MAPTNFVMKRYLTAGKYVCVQTEPSGELPPHERMVVSVTYQPDGTEDYRKVGLEVPISAFEAPDEGDIVVEFPTHVVWMPPEHFTDQFCEV